MAPKMLRSSSTGEVSSEMAETWKDVEAIFEQVFVHFSIYFPVYLRLGDLQNRDVQICILCDCQHLEKEKHIFPAGQCCKSLPSPEHESHPQLLRICKCHLG